MVGSGFTSYAKRETLFAEKPYALAVILCLRVCSHFQTFARRNCNFFDPRNQASAENSLFLDVSLTSKRAVKWFLRSGQAGRYGLIPKQMSVNVNNLGVLSMA